MGKEPVPEGQQEFVGEFVPGEDEHPRKCA